MSTTIFYQRYIPEITAKQSLNDQFPIEGKSPFGDGQIHINEDGTFECEATGTEGTKEDFLDQLYPLLTEEGIQRAIEFESHDDEALSKPVCESRLSSFRVRAGTPAAPPGRPRSA